MKWIQVLLLSIFISLPSPGNGAVVLYPRTIIGGQVETAKQKKEKPRKKIRKWIRNHPGLMIFGGLFFAGLAMLVIGIIRHIKWLWVTGLLTIAAPWFLAILIIILYLFFRTQPKPPYIDREMPAQEKEKTKE